MADLPMLTAGGLCTNPNRTSATPTGAMTRADNVTSSRAGLLSPRERYDDYKPSNYPGVEHHIRAMTVFGENVDGTPRIAWVDNLDVLNVGSTETSTDLPPPNGDGTTFAEANGVLYMTSDTGPKRLPNGDVSATNLKDAGLRRSLTTLNRHAAVVNNLSNPEYNWMPDGTNSAYRFVIGYTDADGRTILGPPSERILVENSLGVPGMPTFTVILSPDLSTSNFIQVHRTNAVPVADDPGDDMALVYERAFTGFDIGSQYAIIDDLAPNEARGTPLYTNSLQEGALNENARPPQSGYLAAFNNRMLYLMTDSPERATFTTLANIAVGDIVTIAGYAIEAVAEGAVYSDGTKFEVRTSGTLSENIEFTVRSLVSNFNYAAVRPLLIGVSEPPCLAYYLSGDEDAPGIVMFEGYRVTSPSFSVSIDSGEERFAPQLPLTSSSENKPGRVYWSKTGQHEAVPLLNYKDLGDVDSAILGAASSRDSIFVFKEDGIWRGSDDGRAMRFDRFDTSARLIGSKTAQALGNQAYGLTNQGVIEVNDTAVTVVSLNIEDELRALLELPENQYPFAVTHEASRTYRLFMYDPTLPTTVGDGRPNFCYVYSLTTGEWTKHLVESTAGCNSVKTDYLFLSTVADDHILQLNTESDEDYVERESFDVDLIDGQNVFVMYTTGGIVPGMVGLTDDDNTYTVTDVDHENHYVFVDGMPVSDEGIIRFSKEIECGFDWAKTDAGSPSDMKHWREMTVVFQEPPELENLSIEMTFKADRSATTATQTTFMSGNAPHLVRCHVPRSHRRSTHMRVGLNMTHLTALVGIEMVLNAYSKRSYREQA
jgi:hypothetical protein